MKSINNYIQEALINKDTKIRPNWSSIKDSKEGDIITIIDRQGKLTFMFKDIYTDSTDDTLVDFYCYYDWKSYEFYCKDKNIRGDVGLVDDYFNGKIQSRLATDDEKRKLFDKMNREGYKWNPIKKEIKKI